MAAHGIKEGLARMFEKHRVVFWYDSKKELRGDFESLKLDGVEKVEIANNEFTLKHRILREQPKQNFLLYKEGEQPVDLQNWLLDIQLAEGEFRTDQAAIWLNELELPNEFIRIVEDHATFFESIKRKESLKKLLQPDDTLGVTRLKMLAVCAGSDARVDNVLENLLAELANEKETTFKLITRCQLDGFFWKQLERHYSYISDSPSLMDFVLELFKTCYTLGVSANPDSDSITLGGDALVFLKRWKDSRTHQEAFEGLSRQSAGLLNIEADLMKRELTDLLEVDYFQIVDRDIIARLVHSVEMRTASSGDITLSCRQRRQSHWYSEFNHLYDAIDVASQFIALLEAVNFNMPTATAAVQGYIKHWFKLDQLYRQYIYALKVSRETTLLKPLTEQLEKLYSNRFLQPLNNEWQRHVDNAESWRVEGIQPQQSFYSKWVHNGYLAKDKKICVIISDAFRYEAGEEMLGRIRQEDRYQAELDAALSVLPSYTQLGMAALLPHDASESPLRIADDKTGSTLIGAQSTQGTANRDKILKAALGNRAAAVTAKSVLEMTLAESRELLKANDLVYLYHNRIDHTGDKMQSEGEAFEATHKTFDDLMSLIKKLTSANASNILITADHGFLYQNSPIPDSDFLKDDTTGDVLYRDRRFLLGKNIEAGNGLKAFSAEQLGLAGEVGALIPKGTQRLRLQGSGSRFVHGGASLQEVIVPVIKINKKRQSDISLVEVEILRAGSSIITSGQLAVTLYQSDPVTDKVQMRRLRVGIYTTDGQLISDQHEVQMDLASENARERELKLRFVLTQEADTANNQEVFLWLEEPVSGTNKYKEYKSQSYTIRRAFTSDFDF